MRIGSGTLGNFRTIGESDASRVKLNDQAEPGKAGRAMAGKQAKLQNVEVRQHFAAALKKAYPQIGAKVSDRLLNADKLEKPLSSKEISSVFSLVDAMKILKQAKLTVGPNRQEVPVSVSMLPRTLIDAHKNDIPGLVAKLQAKVDHGEQLVQQLRSNQLPDDRDCCDVKSAADIAWYVQVAGEAKIGSRYVSGATTMSDPGGRIKKFLDGSGEAYPRKSSHMSGKGGFQSLENGYQRGLDCQSKDGDLDALLPNNRTTILYGRVGKSEKLRMPEERLYFKIEAHGCRLAAPGKLQLRNNEALRDAPRESPVGDGAQAREKRKGDLKQFLLHSADFATGGSADSIGAVNRRETVPSDLKNEFKSLTRACSHDLRKIMNAGNPLSSSTGIRFMRQNAQIALAQAEHLGNTQISEKLTNFITDLETSYPADTLHLRIGEEVILD